MTQGEIRKKWVEALRSGEYKQGKSVLRNVKDEYCCLGVLCDLVAKDQPERYGWEKELEDDGCWIFYEKEEGVRGRITAHEIPLPSVANMIGLVTRNGTLAIGDTLTTMNDDGMSFEQLAKYIEEGQPFVDGEPVS